MKLLVKNIGMQGLVAHMVDAHGIQLCTTRLKRSDWHIVERSPEGITICNPCRHIQERTKTLPMSC
jgi:hypothetical protein